MDMISLVENALKVLNVPVLWQLRPIEYSSITFTFVGTSGAEYAEGQEIATDHLLQVDVWSKNDYATLVTNVKTELGKIGFIRSFEFDDFEEDTQIYHKVIRLNYLENLK